MTNFNSKLANTVATLKRHLDYIRKQYEIDNDNYIALPEAAKVSLPGEREGERLTCLEEAINYFEGAIDELEGALEHQWPPEVDYWDHP